MFYGGALILILILAPTGLLGLVPALLAKLRVHRAPVDTPKVVTVKSEVTQ